MEAAGSSNQNKNNINIDIRTDAENKGIMGGCPKTPVANSMQPIIIEDSEKEWTEVRVGRKKKKNKK